MERNQVLTLTFLCTLFAGLWLYRYRKSESIASPPPGPKALPFIGNTHQLAAPGPETLKRYTQWAEHYGPVVYFRVFGRKFVIINSLKIALDLLDRRSAKYSTRPRFVMAGELVGRNQSSILFTRYGPRLKESRQLLHGWINRNVVKNYASLQEYGSHKIMAKLLERPEDFSDHIREMTGSIALKLTYGIRTKEKNDPYIEMSEKLSDITTVATQPGRWLVDSFPILRFIPNSFPGASFKRWANDARTLCDTIVHTPFEKVEKDMANGSCPTSWTANELSSSKPVDRDILMMTSASIYNGAIGTTVHVIRTFILMMIKHPEIQSRAQREVDAVIGKDQLTELKDIDALPYLACIIKEVLRINPVIPLVPHGLDEDDVYEGYLIPKGSWIMANLWEMSHDSSIYKDPYTFNPDRYDPALGDQTEDDMSDYVFGFGRRSCPGIHFAKANLFIIISHLLSVFDILPVLDEQGKPILPENDFDYGHLSVPNPFRCRFEPRNQRRINLLHELLAAEQTLLSGGE